MIVHLIVPCLKLLSAHHYLYIYSFTAKPDPDLLVKQLTSAIVEMLLGRSWFMCCCH